MHKDDTYLSVIIPAYKEADRIGATLDDLRGYFSDKSYAYEILVIIDGSPDETERIVSEYQREMPQIRILLNEHNCGKGYSVKRGMMESRGKYRLFMDADDSVKIREVETFIDEMESGGHDIAIGSIAFTYMDTKERSGWHRRVFGSISKLLIRIIAIPWIYDTQRGFKVFTARAANDIFPYQRINRFGFDIEILLIGSMHGYSIAELPVEWDNPGGSTVHLADYAKTFVELGNIFMNKARGLYDRHIIRLNGAPLAKRFFYELTYIPRRIIRELIDTPMHLHVRSIGEHGMFYRGKRFMNYTNLPLSDIALYNLARAQKTFLVFAIVGTIVCMLIDWHVTLVVIISTITVLYFLDLLFNIYLMLRSINRNPEIGVDDEEIAALDEASLPRYTIFCPLYKEWQVIPQFVNAMDALDYPKDKLEIIFLLEENDVRTIEEVRTARLPSHFKTVIVPDSNPKTKPKAMNYGLKTVTGEYLVIYDAEDMPESDQIKKAVVVFSKTSPQTICVQAKLNFYNVSQNFLTKIFTAEYSLWFDLILPGLQSLDAPIPLGGTSNHFRVDILRKLSGWDAFNVTEDCDLGMRLAKHGYRTAIIESTTYEEANSDVLNWYNQRSRWIKGYIQTYFVHMRNPQRFRGGWRDLAMFQLTVGGKVFSMFVNPLFWTITATYFLFRATAGDFIESFFPGIILHIGVLSFVFGNFLYLYNYMIGCAKRGFYHLIKYTFFIPFYWFGMSVAAWKAVYEVAVKPHYWSKTVHGLHLSKPVPKPATTS